VADEPTAELDDASERGILEAIRALRARGVAFILATHDPAVTAIADVVVRLDHGEVVDGKRPPAGPATIVDPPRDPPRVGVRCGSGLVSVRPRGDVVHAVDDVSFEAARARWSGSSAVGSGKTPPQPHRGLGRADRRDGRAPARSPEGQPPWRDVANRPQNLGLMDELTIAENVSSPRAGAPRRSVARVDGLLEALG
jgi:energy-coupling factor transporter ATP-binding protein EcfA2